jgi:hypothetical protein
MATPSPHSPDCHRRANRAGLGCGEYFTFSWAFRARIEEAKVKLKLGMTAFYWRMNDRMDMVVFYPIPGQ